MFVYFTCKHFISFIEDTSGSNACTLIAVKFGAYCFQQKLHINPLVWDQLPSVWVDLSSSADHYSVIISDDRSVGFFVKSYGLCAIMIMVPIYMSTAVVVG